MAEKKMKVLIAEDNPVVRKGLINFLKKWGYQPIEVTNGDDAWQILEKDSTIRLAIVDWNIPGLSGMQVCQRLRTRVNKPYVYAIMFSGRKSMEEQILALDGGADDYLVKPCKPSELRARIGVGRRIIEMAFKQRNKAAACKKQQTKQENDKAPEKVEEPATQKEDSPEETKEKTE
jgi:DNA-binding response OmpR family regulator